MLQGMFLVPTYSNFFISAAALGIQPLEEAGWLLLLHIQLPVWII